MALATSVYAPNAGYGMAARWILVQYSSTQIFGEASDGE